MEVRKLGNIYGYTGGCYSGNVYDKYGLAPTINTYSGGNRQPMIIVNDRGFTDREPQITENKEPAEFELGGVFNASYPGSNTRRGRVIDKGATSPTVTAAGEAGGIVQMNREYRIRKLTPRECGRLMGVDDGDIDKMTEVNSNTQLYKQFGNSIVVDVMCYMFQNLNIHINEASKHEEI